MSKQRVAYVYDEDFAFHHYGPGHPVRPGQSGMSCFS